MKRRTFLKAGAAGLALTTLKPYSIVFAQPKVRKVGLIGCGWYGKSALLRLLQIDPAEVVAICDVDRRMLAGAAELIATRQASKKQPKTYTDYREMLAQEQFDIVQVSTPDHWHALAAIAAMKAGADIYVEKPISVDIVEGQAMVAAARKYGRVVQVNMQRRSTPHIIDAKEKIIREGKLGKIGLVEMYCYYHMRAGGIRPVKQPPADFDYEMWTGPAPMRPYTDLVHPRSWRGFMEYSNGILGDMCVHMLDMVRFLMDLGWPKRISSAGGSFFNADSTANIPDTQTATFEYDDLTLIWQHRAWGSEPDPKYPWGATLYGDKGTLKASVMGYDYIPRGGGEAIRKDVAYEYDKYPEDKTEKDLERHVAQAMRWHWKNLLECTQTRSQPVSNIEQGYISASSCILGNMALQLGRTLAFDPQKGNIPGDAEANALLARPYRQPWVHPTPDNV